MTPISGPEDLGDADLQKLVGADWPEFTKFVTTGEANDDFLRRLDASKNLQEALDKAYAREVQKVEVLLKTMPGTALAAPVRESRAAAWRRSLIAGAMTACVGLTVIFGVTAWRLYDGKIAMQADFQKNVDEIADARFEMATDQFAMNAVERLEKGNDRDKLRAAYALASMGPRAESAVPALRDALGDPNRQVRAAVTDALTKVAQPKNIPDLLSAFASNKTEVQHSMLSVVTKLREANPDQAQAPLLAAIRDKKVTPAVKVWTVQILGEYGKSGENSEVADALIDTFEVTGNHWALRNATARAMGAFGTQLPQRGVTLLVNDLKTYSGTETPESYNTLVEYGKGCLPTLEKASPQTNPWVHKAYLKINMNSAEKEP